MVKISNLLTTDDYLRFIFPLWMHSECAVTHTVTYYVLSNTEANHAHCLRFKEQTKILYVCVTFVCILKLHDTKILLYNTVLT